MNIKNKKKYHEHLKLFYNLQRYNGENNLNNFAVIPIIRHGRKHIRYDTQALHQLLRSQSLYIAQGNGKNFQQNREYGMA